MNFSHEAVSPPSSQPAACRMKWQPPSSAPHRLICDSYTACASGAFDAVALEQRHGAPMRRASCPAPKAALARSEEHTSELQSPCNLVCRLLLEKKKKTDRRTLEVTTCYS